MKKILLALLLVACLGLLLFAQAEEAPRGAFMLNVEGQASGVCNLPDDYEVPAALYYDGTRVTVSRVETGLGAYPTQLGDPDELWAYVTIDAGEGETVLSGWVPNICLQYDGETARSAPPLPQGKLAREAALYLDNGITDQVLGRFGADTPVELLGSSNAWLHVRIKGQMGFIHRDDLIMDEALQGLSFDGFDEVMLGHLARYEEYMARRDALMGGLATETSELDLETRAKVSQLAQEYGFTYMRFINLVPDQGDLTQAQAIDKGWAAIQAHFGYDKSDVSRLVAYFYAWPDAPQERFWRIQALSAGPKPNVTAILNAAGEPVDYEQGMPIGPVELPHMEGQALRDAQENIHYYLARIEQEAPEGALTRGKAVELAWDRFLRDVPDARREDFEVVNATFHSLPQENAAWWLVRVMHKDAPIGGAAYDMAVLLPDGDRVVTGDSAAFTLDMKAQQEVQRLRALEAERGPFTVWSKEQKADFYPQFYRLPGEGDVSEEQAVSIARKALNERFGVTEEALDALRLVTALTGGGVWRIEFYEPQWQGKEPIGRYAVAINAADGRVVDVLEEAPIGNG